MTKKAHSFKIDFSNEKVTSFGGLALVERLASRLGLWGIVDRGLPARRGCRYDWASVLKAMTAGLLTGSRGLSAGEEGRGDGALLSFASLDGAPEWAEGGRVVGGRCGVAGWYGVVLSAFGEWDCQERGFLVN